MSLQQYEKYTDKDRERKRSWNRYLFFFNLLKPNEKN